MNPLDWPAGPFLQFYICLGLASAAVILLQRASLGPFRGHDQGLGPLEVAWLSGGRNRVADTILVGFFSCGAAVLDARRQRITYKTSGARVPAFAAPYRNRLSGGTTRTKFHNAVARDLEAIRSDLMSRGLAPGDRQLARLRTVTLLLLATMIAVGLAKIAIGVSRDRPVGFLVCLVLAVTVGGVIALLNPPVRTRAGAAALARCRRDNSRAARAPQKSEVALAFAITGPAVLAGTAYAGFRGNTSSGDSSSSGSSGCGSDSGGGGGGCGGCGGSS